MTGQNRGLSGQKNIWLAIMTGNLLSVIFSPVGSGQHPQTDIHSTLFGGRKVYCLMSCHVTSVVANEKELLREQFTLCSLL